MKKYVVLLILIACEMVHAEPPVVGLWEQFRPSGDGIEKSQHRVDFIFTNKPVAIGTVFSAISDAGTKVRILCCVQTQSTTHMDLSKLLSKYKLTADDTSHLKTIKGLDYVYEGKIVSERNQNRNMRDLIENTNNPDDQSPYSSAIVAGDLRNLEFSAKGFKLDGHAVTFESIIDSSLDVTRYEFKLDGQRARFTESNFPD
ncbi:hypothetical protein [Paraburkholderia hospita]|jgi:hypothetical protein|uniref:Uncharacterized protein n=2 Tax=Paraburkholderia hospita TaxID=169430 RepID=A0ABN0FTS2_9BURK|nr:hypothetical protein [Paraburkholderia hospita]EIN02167.1 hypothetical protein WQE_05312 [Paraburkholderia hospita]OUL82714.1 hypothetical protein CA602_23695 [Paraburkholderia hospita]OUL82772.1 hypothetical protein CA601_28745 [Paraburkholderia hospita]SEH52623.1 hypothetical protein SAMN05192544_100384 [Paraburkholderia hospita]